MDLKQDYARPDFSEAGDVTLRRTDRGDDPSRYDDADAAELRDRIDDLEGELEACRTRVEQLQQRRDAYESTIVDHRTFPESIHEQLRSVGTDARSSVLSVRNPDHYLRSNGTAWVAEEGVVVTATPVLDGPDEAMLSGWTGPVPDGPDDLTLESFDGTDRPVERETVDEATSTAIIDTETDGLDPLAIGSAADLEDGDPLLVLGHPAYVGQWVMSLGRYVETDDRTSFRIDCPVSPATTDLPFLIPSVSGAPVFDVQGRVVGMILRTQARTSNPAPGTYSRSEQVFQGIPDTRDLVALDGQTVADALSATDASLEGSPSRTGGRRA